MTRVGGIFLEKPIPMKHNAQAVPGAELETVWAPNTHCPELDGVRGIAILMVTLYRYIKDFDASSHPIIQGICRVIPIGERGVDLFFVLSGFLITGILMNTKTGPCYWRNFFMRRALRIFPLYFTTLIICLWVIPSFVSIPSFSIPPSEQFYLWTYLTNVRMAWLNLWCFGPLDHFWSLAVEEHFYLVWPLIVFWLSDKNLLRLSVGAIVGVGVTRVVCAMRPEFDVAVEVLTMFRCDSLCFGAGLAIFLKHGSGLGTMETIARWTMAPMLIVAVGAAWTRSRGWTLTSTLWPCIWMLLLGLLLTRHKGHWMSRTARLGFLRWLGKYSYGMYVAQLPMVSLIDHKRLVASLSTMFIDPLAVFFIDIAILFSGTMLCGFLSYHLLEKHCLRWKRLWS